MSGKDEAKMWDKIDKRRERDYGKPSKDAGSKDAGKDSGKR